MGKFLCSIFKSGIFWAIVTAIICLAFNVGINIIIAYLWSFLINKFLSSYLFIKYFIILILFLYNYFILRLIVISWLFEWQFPIQIFSIYRQRQNYLAYLKKRLNNFINAIEVILDVKFKISKKEIDDIEDFLILFDKEFKIYDKLYNIVTYNLTNNYLVKYKMSKYQMKYYDLLKSINRIFLENNTKDNLLNLKNNDNDFSENNIKMNNFTVNQNFENKKNLNHLIMLLNEYKKIIAKYDINNYTYMSPVYLYNLLLNDTFGSLSLFSLQFKERFKDYHLEEDFTKKGKVHYTLIQKNKNIDIEKDDNNLILNNSKIENNDVLLLFCLPNGGIFELIDKTKIDFYTKMGFSFLCWNYKGYGYSKGKSNFSNIKSDILELYDTVMNNPKYNFKKICVMGHSIGGVAACYLANNRHVDLLISDRNFCDMTRLVNNLYCGKFLSCLIKYLFIGKTDNIINFIKFSNIEDMKKDGVIKINNENKNNFNRIIIYSPIDMLILNDSTVKSGVSRYIIKKYIIYKNKENNQIIKNKENLLDIVFNKNDKSQFINNFIGLIQSYYNKKKNYIDYYKNNDVILNEDNKNDKNENLIDEMIDFKKLNQVIKDTLFLFFDKFFGICCDNLNYITRKKLSLRRQIIFIDNFFNNLLIWGVQDSHSNEDDYFEFNSYKGKIVLKQAYNILNKYNLNREQINIKRISTLIYSVSEDLKKILDVIDNLDIVCQENKNTKKINIQKDNDILINDSSNTLKEKLINSNEEESEIITNSNIDIHVNKENDLLNVSNFYSKLNNIKGNIKLFKTFAGHNGLLKEDERNQFCNFVLKSGIID